MVFRFKALWPAISATSNKRNFNSKSYLTHTFTLIILLLPIYGLTQSTESSLVDLTRGLERSEGFIPFYWDEAHSRIMLEITDLDTDVLYYVSAASGGGSVELPIDRGILKSSVIHFHRSGSSVLVIEKNLDYRAVGGSDAQVRNVDLSFPSSTLAVMPIMAIEGEMLLVDSTNFFMRDSGGLESRLARVNEASFRFDPTRSVFYPEKMHAFPENTEIETLSTFDVSNSGVVVNNIVPDSSTLTLHIHHSFLKAPEGYTPRLADPRIGIGSISFSNYANDFNDGTEENWISRWRLEKQNPDAAMSKPVEPIIFYFDPAIPEPIKSAMKEGTLWWNEAFEAAGFIDAIEVRDPLPGMDPMDIRYAWVLWIDRDERGFSSGGTFRDPRTGEVLGSKTRMDSHRIRTIANYWESYRQLASDDLGTIPAEQSEMVLLRQALLTAHELGHVLGFGHNWASSINERASVMEYPTPRVKVVDGELDLSESFEHGVGAYDIFMTRYAYEKFSPEEELANLDAIIAEMRAAEILYVPDTDPRWAWYDDRATPTEYLRETISARKIMMENYGVGMLEDGEPLGELRDLRFWMSYLHHRWAIEAGIRYIGGVYHNIVVKGEDLAATQIVPTQLQEDILSLLLNTINPENLEIPERLLKLLTTHPGNNLEDMSADYLFDQLQAARILAAMVIEPLLDSKRTARLVALADRQPDTLGLPDVVQGLLNNTWYADSDSDRRHASLRQVTQNVMLNSMMALGGNESATPEVRVYILDQLYLLSDFLKSKNECDPMIQAHYRQAARDIQNYLADPNDYEVNTLNSAWGDRPRSRFPLPPGPPL